MLTVPNKETTARTAPIASPREGARACEVVFAILAHDSADCLALQMDILKRFAPTSKCLVFDASPSRCLTKELGIVPCSDSRPLQYGRLAPFHIAAMRAAEEISDYEFLITMDSDMLLLRPGIVDYLRRVMRNADYMAPHFREIPWWIRSDSHRRFLYCWKPYWQSLLGTPRPYRVMNCFQIFRRGLVTRFLEHKRTDEIIEATMPERTALVALEEAVYPTLAVFLGGSPIAYPGSHTIDTSPVSVSNLVAYRHDPNVIFAHSGTRDVRSAAWQCVRAWSLGIECIPPRDRPPRKRSPQERLRSLLTRACGDMKVITTLIRQARY